MYPIDWNSDFDSDNDDGFGSEFGDAFDSEYGDVFGMGMSDSGSEDGHGERERATTKSRDTGKHAVKIGWTNWVVRFAVPAYCSVFCVFYRFLQCI